MTLPYTRPRRITITLDSIFFIQLGIITVVVIISLFLLSSIFEIQVSGKPVNIDTKVFKDLIKWADKHQGYLAAMAIIVTILLFFFEQLYRIFDERLKFLEQKSYSLISLKSELDAIKNEIRNGSKIKESSIEITDTILSTEIYEKISLESLDLHPVSYILLKDYYKNVKTRNRLFIHRIESKRNFYNSLTDSSGEWRKFIDDLDKNIKKHEDYLNQNIRLDRIIKMTDAQYSLTNNELDFLPMKIFIHFKRFLLSQIPNRP